MQPLICETVTGRSMAELLAARDACCDCDLVELRLDGVADLDVAGALKDRRHPVVVTCRPVWEGGRFDGPEETRRSVLQEAFDLGAEYVDIEWRAGFEPLVRAHADRVVLSMHDFKGVPPDLIVQARAMRSLGTSLVKLAVMPSGLRDLAVLREVAAPGHAIVIAMGGTGLPSRLLAAHFGSRWSYAGEGAAPGQVPASRMVGEFRFRTVHAGTAVYGVVGNNVTHSLSPAMHNAAFAAAGLDAVYVPLLASDFDDFLAFARDFGVQGASVTIPYKLDAFRAASEADARATAIGAANTLKRVGGRFAASNTDVDGFLAPLEAMYPGSLRGVRAAVLGAGGAARAAVVGLVSRGAHVTVHARRDAQARELATALGAGAGPWPVTPGSWDLLVNCTPAGSAAARDESPLPERSLSGAFVYDLTYRSPGEGESPLLVAARRAGCLTLDGLPMLVAQAERQFAWWTGQPPREGVMAAATQRHLHQAASR
jgi:3-dehydroquinate dehydratase/shikimate dehydrogenase